MKKSINFMPTMLERFGFILVQLQLPGMETGRAWKSDTKSNRFKNDTIRQNWQKQLAKSQGES